MEISLQLSSDEACVTVALEYLFGIVKSLSAKKLEEKEQVVD
jgi:hypothetical protein